MDITVLEVLTLAEKYRRLLDQKNESVKRAYKEKQRVIAEQMGLTLEEYKKQYCRKTGRPRKKPITDISS